MKYFHRILLLLLIFLINSCSPKPFSYSGLGAFEKGIEKQIFLEKIDLEPNFTYSQNTNLSKSPLDILVFEDHFLIGNSSYKFYDLNVFIFVESKLYTWGRIDDLKKHPTEEIRKLMKTISAKLKEDL